jgi:hypothetical protein
MPIKQSDIKNYVDASNEHDVKFCLLFRRRGAGRETDKAVGVMAAMLGAFVKNAIERA